MKVKPILLETAILDKTWWHWMETERDRVGLTDREAWFLAKRYPFGAESRRTNKAERFEQWLFTQGAGVRRVAGKCYLEFTDESQATMFALKWS